MYMIIIFYFFLQPSIIKLGNIRPFMQISRIIVIIIKKYISRCMSVLYGNLFPPMNNNNTKIIIVYLYQLWLFSQRFSLYPSQFWEEKSELWDINSELIQELYKALPWLDSLFHTSLEDWFKIHQNDLRYIRMERWKGNLDLEFKCSSTDHEEKPTAGTKPWQL